MGQEKHFDKKQNCQKHKTNPATKGEKMMLKVEQYILIEIVKLMPKFGIDYSLFEYENPFITSATLYNWAGGRTKPRARKYSLVMDALKTKYSEKYNQMIKIVEEQNGQTIENMLRDELEQAA